MNLTIFLVFYLLLSISTTFSQNSGIKSTVLLKGRVFNYKNSTPLETKFFLVQNDGKKIQVKSSSDGSFFIPISTSGEYLVQSDNWLCIDPLTIDITVGEQYAEKDVVLHFLPFEAGLVLKKVNGFNSNTQELTDAGKEALQYICKLNQFTPKLNFTIKLSIEESQFKTETKVIVEGKKKKKIKISPREKAEEFAKFLIEKINEFLASCKMPQRKFSFQIEYLNTSGTPSVAKKIKKHPSNKREIQKHYNLEITIGSILKTDIPEKK